MKLKTNKICIKELRKKIKNQKNEDYSINKQHMTNYDWMMKLKKNQNFTKESRIKIRN
jgi:hypothetical protein